MVWNPLFFEGCCYRLGKEFEVTQNLYDKESLGHSRCNRYRVVSGCGPRRRLILLLVTIDSA